MSTANIQVPVAPLVDGNKAVTLSWHFFFTNLANNVNAAGVTSFNSRTGLVTLESADVLTALGYTPYNSTNPSNYITGNQTITLTGDVTGSGTTSIAGTLATVNSDVGSFTNANITVDAKGRVTAAANGTGGGGTSRSISSVSTNTNAGSTASTDYVYLVSGGAAITLPTAVGNTNLYTVKNTDGSAVTVVFTSGQNADGSTSISIPIQYMELSFISNNANWDIV